MGKPKPVNYELIAEDPKAEHYKLLSEAREKWHSELHEARVALAWRKNQKPDKDGHLVLGKCQKVTDLMKEFAEYDFVIVLNYDVWNDPEFSKQMKLALLDHELCHAAIMEDGGEHKYDERDRPVFRIRKHDVEEFYAVVHRHGTYKRDLEKFAELLLQNQRQPLLRGNGIDAEAIAEELATRLPEGISEVSVQVGGKRATRQAVRS